MVPDDGPNSAANGDKDISKLSRARRANIDRMVRGIVVQVKDGKAKLRRNSGALD
jgi:hypothetical protein